MQEQEQAQGGVREAAFAVRGALAAARVGLVDREVGAEVVTLCAVAGEHLLVVGAPGTAKSLAVRLIAEQLGGRYFECLLGRFTEPNEIFGPVDLRRLREGVVEIETAGMLPEAEIAFLDEVFLGSTAIRNTLLGLLNERVFRRGATVPAAPLRVCVGAANHVPQDPSLAAFADRFLARVFVDPVADARLEELLEEGDTPTASGPVQGSPDALAGVDRLAEAARVCELGSVRLVLATAVRRLRAAGVPITDRRGARSQRLVAAAAVLDGRAGGRGAGRPVDVATDRADGGRAGCGSLCHAAEEYSHGSAARARRLAATGRDLLARFGPEPRDGDRRPRLEAVLREIDAGFATPDLDVELAAIRARLIAAVQS
ncbi:AAA family ATPase [Embleya sp. NPDC059259]|uniref:AAA family ATPase n=1 Tax=unclassified Embleya TaxID=2699296 RepID=UPI0036BBF8B4